MEQPPQLAEPARHPQLEELLDHALLLDVEVSPRGRLLKVGAALGPQHLVRTGEDKLTELGHALDRLVRSARCLLGHNLVRHDLPFLREQLPGHTLLRLPVIDTLVLSPIAFPENPYHRLVKDYKLVRESVNDPLADARQAAGLFEDEWRSLAGLRETEPQLFEVLHYLLATPETESDKAAQGMAMVFQSLGGMAPPRSRVRDHCQELLGRWACRSVPVEDSLLATGPRRMALAYALVWLRVAGANSVLPPWVRTTYPAVNALIQRWRETPCAAADCEYCRRVMDARGQLRSFFGLGDFRATPRNPQGGSLQQDIVEAGLRNESLLAILPTGGGKSLCYQLPALVRNYRRGALTIVISPLQALMKDQVDGLQRRTGSVFGAALYGLLTPPERGDVLRRVRLGDVALLYVSPEQLRNRSFREVIRQREIGCWVFDEAHCLSKWGHDFRPDYLYAGRFIREFSREQGGQIPSIACFTATAKRDVKEEILAYFKAETGRELALFEGGVERENLEFEVQTVTTHAKLERVHELLEEHLPAGSSGCAIVFRATRAAAQESAEYLTAKGWRADRFHAGLTPPEKKRVQDDFLSGAVQVICATNAFGMGIDKEDVRLVVHGDTPGSIENYLQEAGRAGRDGQTAKCVLLYDEADCDAQFRLGAFAELSRRDIAQILRGLRKACRGPQDEVVITTGELLRDEDLEIDIQLADRDADTKVRTAISWLERAGLVERNENVTNVFQARLLVKSLAEAEARIATLNLSRSERALWLAILREFMNAGPADSLTVDRLALLPELAAASRPDAASSAADELREEPPAYGRSSNPEYVSARIWKILNSMSQAGLMKRDTLLNAFVRYQVADASRQRLDRVLQTDRKLVDLLAIEAPDPEGWMPLSLRLLNQRLLEEGCETSTELLRRLMKSLSEDGRGFAGTHGSIDWLYRSRDTYQVRVRRTWSALGELAEKRRRVAGLVLEVLLGKIPPGTPPRADLLVEFSFGDLHQAIDRDLLLRSELKDVDLALERALMFLHEQHVIMLQQGLAVFRSAMTIRLPSDTKKTGYRASDYQPLRHHYRERVFQVHVMSEYARWGLQQIREALGLVLAYFTMDKEKFIRQYLRTRPEMLQYATTAQSFQTIVTDLANPAQIRVVTAPREGNLLVLAGPGSGKTKTVVHRCAYLLKVERVRPQGILVCCFNRRAALELRRRLADLAGPDARGVTVLTYHGLAMRLLGYSYAALEGRKGAPIDLDALIPAAVQLLQGKQTPPGLEADEVRDRLLAGFQHILVDEYQDIDEPQYQLISALAGRTLRDDDLKLSLLAVGDDDQNIYSFRGANVEFIRRFAQDYQAGVHYLVENYRATRHLIETANQWIALNTDRMKTDHPIRINQLRERHPPGGQFGEQDPQSGGRVLIIQVPNPASQACAVLAQVQHLRDLGVTPWSRIAVLARTHRELARVRGLTERANIPVRWWAERDRMPPLHGIREIHRYLGLLESHRGALARATTLIQWAVALEQELMPNPWTALLGQILEAWRIESDDAELPLTEAREFIYETLAESRRDYSYGEGVVLSTVHAAKGTEHDHVLLIGEWPRVGHPIELEETRRLFYVGMTRARQSLAIFERNDLGPVLTADLAGPAVLRRPMDISVPPEPPPVKSYAVLGLDDLHLSFAGYHPKTHPVHTALANLATGDRLMMAREGGGVGLFDPQGLCVSRLSQKAEAGWLDRLPTVREVRILALVYRSLEQDDDSSRRERCQVSEWEVPIVEVTSEGTDVNGNA